jgi:hypothetical protein
VKANLNHFAVESLPNFNSAVVQEHRAIFVNVDEGRTLVEAQGRVRNSKVSWVH